jgi:hypothetical protein
VHHYLLEDAVAVGIVAYNMLATLQDIETLLGDVEAAALGVHTAVAMDDVAYSVVLGRYG